MQELIDLNKLVEIPTPENSAQLENEHKYNLKDFEVIFGVDVAELVPILSLKDILVLSRGNISTIKGKAKARKSFFVALVISLVLKQNPDLKILLVDTEQSKHFVVKVMKRIYRLMEWTSLNDQIKILSVRELEFMQRREILVQAIEEFKSDFIVLDGGVDIIADFNNPEESKDVVGLLMKLSSMHDCHILSILHEGKTNAELRGHYGAEMLNKSETVFEVSRDEELSNVKPYATRNMPFEEFNFRIEDGLPIYNGEVIKMTVKEMKEYNMKLFTTKLLAPDKMMEYEEFANEYAEMAGCTTRTAKNHLSIMLKSNFIVKSAKLYRLFKCEPTY